VKGRKNFLLTGVTRKSLCFTLIGLIILSSFGFMILIQNASAAPTSGSYLKLKWWKYLGQYAKTYGAPLAANLVGDASTSEIVVVGGSSDGGTDGTVTVLDGRTGATVWQKQYISGAGIGMHTLFELADLDRNGVTEIIIGAKYSTLVLRGNDGTEYWRNRDAPAAQTYPAVADIDGDGYMEVFVSRGLGVANGYDWVTVLSYDGNILHQAYNWRTCFGGVTIGDADSDGVFELYVGDRSNRYSAHEEPYKGGGMGPRALDPYALTPLWNDPTVLASSQAPILADVDKDGILDVIVADQGNDGIAVLNSADGSVVTTGGIYRKGGTNMPAHSQPTVYDVDEDGNLELIDNKLEGSFPIIWDLYDWKYDWAIPVTMVEPPKVGDVANLGSNYAKMEIIVPTWGKMYIYAFNKITKAYEQVDYVSGLSQPRPFTLVQDVDGDALNELIVTSSAGYVYAYDTQAPSPNPRTRSVNQFYSEYRRGAAEYVSPPLPSRPVIREEYPKDTSLNLQFNPTLSIRATDFQGENMDIVFSTNVTGTWKTLGSYSNVGNGVYTQSTSNMDLHGTTYFWRVDVTDASGNNIRRTYSFTTHSDSPTQGSPLLRTISGDIVVYNQTTNDADGDPVTNIYNWYVDGASFTNVLLPFDTRRTNNPLISDEIFSDGFESNFDKWNGNGATDWDLDSTQKHSGTYSAHAGSADNYLTLDSIDTHSAEGITVSFWYRDSGIDDDDNVYLQFWNGSSYVNIFEIGNSKPEGIWQWYTVQTYDPRYMIDDFRVRFNAVSIDTGENLWIDDFSITVPTRTKDYSVYGNHATVHGATWIDDGVVGGAYTFDGINDFIRIPDDVSLGGDGTWSEITLEFWIKPEASMKGTPIIAKKVPYNEDNTGSFMIGFRTDKANALYWAINSTTAGWKELRSSTVLTNNRWYHIVATYKSGQGMRIYISGSLSASMSLAGNIAPSSGESIFNAPLFIGYDGQSRVYPETGQTPWLKGSLDEIRIYPKALTPNQILQRYQESKDGLSNSSTMVEEETAPGEEWKAEVTPNDSFTDGTSQFSNPSLPPVQHNLIIQTEGSGTTSPVPGTWVYNEGTEVSVTAYPDTDWMLFSWLLNNTNVGSANPYTLTMDANYNLTAVFVEMPPELFSDGFESGDFRAWDGISFSSAETATVVSTFSRSGVYSARFTSNGNALRESAYSFKAVQSSSELYARGFVWIGSSGIVDNDDRFYFIMFRGGGNGLAYGGWRRTQGQVRWSLITRDGNGWVSAYSTLSPLANMWYSVELHWVGDATNGYAELYVDGALVVSISGRNTAALGGTDQVRFGLAELYSCMDTVVYGDDFKISKERIGFNNLPSAPTTDITPAEPLTSDDLVCVITTPSVDIDGDPVSYSHQWYRNGELQLVLTTDTVPYQLTTKNETWRCVVTPFDGKDYGPSVEAQVLIRNSPPRIDTYTPTESQPSMNEGESLVFTHTSSDPDNDTLAYEWWLDGAFKSPSQNWTYMADYDAAGTHNITLLVSDGSLADFQQWNVTANGVNQAPKIDTYYPLTNATIYEGQSQEFNITNSDPDGDLLTVEWFVNGTLNTTGNTFTFVATFDSAGTFNITVVVADPSLATATHTWLLTVLNVNRQPIIETYTPEDLTPDVNEGDSLNFTHTSSDPDGDTVSYSWVLDGLPRETTQNWTYTPSFDEAGYHNITLVVSDGQLTVSVQWNVTVIDVNRLPSAPTVEIVPAEPFTDEDLVCIIITPSIDLMGIQSHWVTNGTKTTCFSLN